MADPVTAAYLEEVRERIALACSPAAEPVPGDDRGNARLRLWLEDSPRLLALADEVLNLRERTRRQAAEIDHMRRVAERKNRELDALHLVWCDGGCGSGVHRWHGEKISAELVAIAERNTKRLKRWYHIVKWRLDHYTAGTETRLAPGFIFKASPWHEEYARRNAAKTDLLEERGG